VSCCESFSGQTLQQCQTLYGALPEADCATALAEIQATASGLCN
jgi:hypothetical protein